MGVGSSLPDPSFPLRREILAQGGSLLVSVCLVWVVLATSAGPHIPVWGVGRLQQLLPLHQLHQRWGTSAMMKLFLVDPLTLYCEDTLHLMALARTCVRLQCSCIAFVAVMRSMHSTGVFS